MFNGELTSKSRSGSRIAVFSGVGSDLVRLLLSMECRGVFAMEHTHEQMLTAMRDVIAEEAAALRRTAGAVGAEWLRAVEVLRSCRGKVVFLGIGKAGHVGQKVAATFASLGIPAHFVHAAEAVHGDMGMVAPGDVLVALSHSGATLETLAPIATIRSLGVPVVAITSCRDSPLARQSDAVIVYPVREEADHLGLAPTASATAMMAVGDALAVLLSQLKGFTRSDFARFHPGGALGEALRLTHGGFEPPKQQVRRT